jgi:hypothetical protein
MFKAMQSDTEAFAAGHLTSLYTFPMLQTWLVFSTPEPDEVSVLLPLFWRMFWDLPNANVPQSKDTTVFETHWAGRNSFTDVTYSKQGERQIHADPAQIQTGKQLKDQVEGNQTCWCSETDNYWEASTEVISQPPSGTKKTLTVW